MREVVGAVPLVYKLVQDLVSALVEIEMQRKELVSDEVALELVLERIKNGLTGGEKK